MATSDIGKGAFLNVKNKDTGEIEKKTLIPPSPSDGDLGGISEEELEQITTNKEKISSLNVELTDGRTDVDGEVHKNIGDAMRGQARKLRENLVVRQKEQPTDPNNNVWISDEDDEVEVPDMGEFNSLNEDIVANSNELYNKEKEEIAVEPSDYNLLENKVAYIDTKNEIAMYDNANAYVMQKTVASGEKYRITSQAHGSVNTLLYAICDSNGKVINSSKMNVSPNTYITTEIEIPSNGVELYLNEFPTQTYPLVVNKIETINISKINGKETVNCWGDSLTRGVGVGDSYSKAYPYVLYGLLDGRKVINCGVGGENTINIASRQGGLPNIVKPFTIPADTNKVEIELTNIYGDSTGILLQGGSALDPTTDKYVMTAQINPCSIKGVEGTLTHENGKYYFSRSENGESVIVSRPTPLITYAMKSMRDNINIIWLGTNGGFTTSAELVENIEAMIDYMTPINKKYIVFGIHHLVSTVTETFETIEKNMAMHFGRHYINQRKYMIEYGLSDAGITPTVEDATAISQGKIPPSLLYDDVHYNDKGYNIIATLASERGKELGYW
jgi:lysophospholipase L1-like esterase